MAEREFVTILGFKTDLTGLAAYDAALKNLVDKANKANEGFRALGEKLTDIGSKLSMTITAPIVGFATAAVLAHNKLEDMTKEWEVLLGSSKAGKEFVENVEKLEEKTPFKTEEILAYTKEMKSLGVEQEDLLSTFQQYADISAKTGIAPEALINRFTMMKNMAREFGYVMSRDIKGLVKRGLLTRAEMSQLFGITNIQKLPAQIRMSESGVDKFVGILGRRSAGSAEERANTTSKAFERLGHAVFKFFAAVGDVIVRNTHLNRILQILSVWLERATEFITKMNDSWAKWIIIILGVAAAVGPILFMVGTLMKTLTMTATIIKILLPLIIEFGATGAVAFGWITLIVAGIGSLLLLADDLYYYVKYGADASLYGGIFESVVNAVLKWVDDIVGKWFSGIDAIGAYFKKVWQDLSDWYMGLPVLGAVTRAVSNWANSPSSGGAESYPMGAWGGIPNPATGVTIGTIQVNAPGATPETVAAIKEATKASASTAYDEVQRKITGNIQRYVKQ